MTEKHPSWEEILSYVEGAESAAPTEPAETPTSGAPADSVGPVADSLRDHLRHCAPCARLAEKARRLLKLLARHRAHSPSPRLTEETLRIVLAELAREEQVFREAISPPSLGHRSIEALREAWATLVEDSRVPSPVMRGTAVTAAPRMLLYETASFSITVSLVPRVGEQSYDVRGQVTPLAASSLPPGGTAVLRRGKQERRATLSEYGEFAFKDTSAEQRQGLPDLEIALADSLIRLSFPPETKEA